MTSRRQDNYTRTSNLRNRFQSVSLTARSIPGHRWVSPRTVRNRLREANIHPQRPAIRPTLLQRHREARLAWCRRHRRFNNRDWVEVLFTDESRFHIDSSDSRSRTYRRVGERYSDACVIQRRPYGGGSVIVWGGITAHGRTPLVVVDGSLTGIRYRDKIVRHHVMPFIRNSQHNVILQQDYARPHTARVVSDYLRQQNVNVLPWPAMSPDLSPIEHVLDEMERLLHQESTPLLRWTLCVAL